MRPQQCLHQVQLQPNVSQHISAFSRSRIRCSAACKVRQRPRRACCAAAAPGFAPPKQTGSYKKQAQNDKAEVEDKLIAAFQSKPKSDWRKLITYSKKWPSLSDGVFKRCCSSFTRSHYCAAFPAAYYVACVAALLSGRALSQALALAVARPTRQ